MTDRELMQQALDALDLLARYENPATKVQVRKPRDGGPIVTIYPHKVATEAAVPLRARLAQPEQAPTNNGRYLTGYKAQPEPEPVAWMYVNKDGECEQIEYGVPYNDPSVTPLYTAPPQREWQGLTEEEVDECYYWKDRQWTTDELVRHVEAKLKEKNS